MSGGDGVVKKPVERLSVGDMAPISDAPGPTGRHGGRDRRRFL
jgi:hypothetical protein